MAHQEVIQDFITPTETTGELPAIRSIGPADLIDALAKGLKISGRCRRMSFF